MATSAQFDRRSNNATLVRGSDIACTENPAHQCVSESETSERRGTGHWACTVRGRATEVAYAMRDMSKACGMSWHVGQSSSYAAVSGPNRRSARGASAGRHARQGARRSGRSDGVGKCRKMEIADRGRRNASRSTKIGRDVKRESQGVKRGVACEPDARSTNEAMEPAAHAERNGQGARRVDGSADGGNGGETFGMARSCE